VGPANLRANNLNFIKRMEKARDRPTGIRVQQRGMTEMTLPATTVSPHGCWENWIEVRHPALEATPSIIKAPTQPGESKRIAMVSPDGKIAAFAEALPFPTQR